MTIDWPALIGRHVLVQQQITELDAEALWGHELPGLAASPAEVAALETQTGLLPDAYREFLLAANGWPAFDQWVDLFSVAELLGERRAEAHQLCAAS